MGPMETLHCNASSTRPAEGLGWGSGQAQGLAKGKGQGVWLHQCGETHGTGQGGAAGLESGAATPVAPAGPLRH